MLALLGKVMEALIMSRVNYYLHVTGQMSKRQYGFTEQTSTIDLLEELIKQVEGRKSNEAVALVSLDIKGAFDHAKWSIIVDRLIEYKLPRNMVKSINSYLEERKVLYKMNDGIVSKQTSQGCVQGSIFGPFLWNIVLNDIFKLKLSPGVEMLAFADDITVVASDKCPKQLERKLMYCLHNINQWGQANGPTFSPAKTQFMAFTKNAKDIKLSMNKQTIGQKTSVKILGITIDEKLKFDQHVTNVLAEASRIYQNITRIARITWGISSDILREIYLRAIEPIVTYGCPIWQRALGKQSVMKEVARFQRKFINRIAKAYRTVALEVSQVIANIIPLELKIEEISQIHRVKKTRKCELIDADIEHQSALHFTEMPHPVDRTSITFTRVNSQRELEELLDKTKFNNTYNTDGSIIDGKTGAAWILASAKPENDEDILREQKIKMNSICSVFQAELNAIGYALEDYLRNGSETHDVNWYNVCSDCLSALTALEDRNNKNRLVQWIHSLVRRLRDESIEFRFFWTKAHVDIDGNNIVDEKAKQAASKIDTDAIECKFPLNRAKYAIRNNIMRKWNERYLRSKRTTTLRHFIPNLTVMRDKWKYTRPDFFSTQVLTGHGAFKQYLKRFKLSNDDKCKCGKTQDNLHILKECPIFEIDRIMHSETIRNAKSMREIHEFTNSYLISVMKKLIIFNNVSYSIKYVHNNI